MPRRCIEDERPEPEWLGKIAEMKKKATKTREPSSKTFFDPRDISQKMAVDHRNVRTSWKSSEILREEDLTRTRHREDTLEPPPVPYPHQLRPTKAFEDSAVATFAKSRGTRRRFLKSSGEEDSGAQFLAEKQMMSQSDGAVSPKLLPEPPTGAAALGNVHFLRLDESKLPMEIFDSGDYEEKDKSPAQWLSDVDPATGFVMGYAAYYAPTAGEEEGWRWRKCKVVGYEESTRLFTVEMGANKTKGVSRLNLRFAVEDEAKWTKRRAAAHAAREVVKQQLRLDYFVAEQPTSMRPMQQRALRGIHSKIHSGLPIAVAGDVFSSDVQEQSKLCHLLGALTAEVIQAYARAMKRAIVRQRHTTDVEFAQEYRALQLPASAVAPPKPAPARAKVPVPSHPYLQRRSAVAAAHFSASRQVLETFVWLRSTWESDLADQRFVIVADGDSTAVTSPASPGGASTSKRRRNKKKYMYPEDGGLDEETGGGKSSSINGGLPFALPCEMNEFAEAQRGRCEAFATVLKSDWRTAFAEQVVDNVQDVFDFFQSNTASFEVGPLRKLLTHFELRMTAQLREALCNSLDDWVAFIRRFTTTQQPSLEEQEILDEEGAAAAPAPAASSAEEGEAPVWCKNGLAALEARRVGMRSPPLFAVKLVVTGAQQQSRQSSSDNSSSHHSLHVATCRIEPSHEDIEDALLARIDEPVERIRELRTLDSDLMSLLHLPQRILLDVGADNPLVADVDAKLEWARDEVRDLLAGAMLGPQALADRYNDFAWIAGVETVSHVRAFVRSEPSLEKYVAEVTRFHEASSSVERLSENFERFAVCAVDTTGAKRALTSKAREVEMALLTHVVHEARSENEATIQRYEQILARLSEQPTNESELASLKAFIADSRIEVLKMVEAVERMHARLATFDAFGVLPLSREDTFLAWSTMEFPKRVHDASNECEMRIEMDKVRMMDRLAIEKNEFDEMLSQYETDVQNAKEYSDYAMEHKYVEEINRLQDNITEAKAKAADFNQRESVFGFPPTEYAELQTVEVELNPYWDLWNMISDFHSNQHEWLHGAFLDLDGSKIQKEVEVWWKSSYKLKNALEEKTPGAAACAASLREETSKFREHLPMIQALASPALKERHWQNLSEKIGSKITPYDEHGVELTLQALLDMRTYEHITEIQEVCVAAEKEYGLERQLQQMKDDWALVAFEVKAYKTTGTSIVGGIDEIVTLLDDHLVKTQTMCGSMFIKAIEEDAKAWEAQLKYAQQLVDEWISCQRVWMYLEPIFGSEDIMRQLPTEARRFNDVDKLWRATMKATEEDPIFIAQAEPAKKLKRKFVEANEKLDKIQKGLSDYLEMKRLFFPRFFFLADEQMLEILSQSKEPRAVQPHLGKAFEGLNMVKFEKDLKISEMISGEGERVALITKVDPESPTNKGNVERWLLELESLQWASVRKQVELALADYPTKERTQWTLGWCAQAILATAAMFWTADVERTLEKGGSKLLGGAYVEKLNTGLTDIVMLVRGQLSKLQRQTLGALVVMDVHARDTVLTMCKQRVEKKADFDWVSQLRYYWAPSWKDGQAVKKGDNTVVAKIVNAKCLYGYEYLGNSMRLVITPLTDRCYRTMISAIDLLYGGAPEGPAGTGKTETVKDLSKAMAIQCVVFNCSDGLDYKAMAKFFKGLAGCGSWCCFDEFNRINVEVLSVIAQQILTINKGKAAGVDKFHFEGTFMKLNPNANPFITMNPGYAGRAELPDNLKALFRPCAMMVPDYALIGEIRLYSFGFEDARRNAQKLVRTLQLCSEQLSSQKHYDYGMRAVNSILVAAGNLRLKVGDDPLWDESKIVLRSVMDVNLPKFTADDLPLFRGITSDLFPGVSLPTADHGALIPTIDEVCMTGVTVAPGRTFKLDPIAEFTLKIVQLYEMVLVRHGVMVVGETCSGKTCAVHTLASAMTRCHERGESLEKVKVMTMNPKSILSGQLYGNFDENTHEWSDGVLAVIFRNAAMDTGKDRIWIMFDGPVDAVWIENMNTVLDDNKKLCLMSGEIIKMTSRMTMMFEAEDLEQASPATVSRVGMVFTETRNLGWQPFLKVWLEHNLAEMEPAFAAQSALVQGLYEWLFPPCAYFVHKFCAVPTPVTQIELMRASLRLMDCFISAEEDTTNVERALEGFFIKSIVWSIGACVDFAGREKFDAYLRILLAGDQKALEGCAEYLDFKNKTPDYDDSKQPKSSNLLCPPVEGLVYDFKFNAKQGTWASWVDNSQRFVIAKDAEFNSIVVPTVDTLRHEWLITAVLTRGYHALCTGDTGTGKSVSIKTHRLLSGADENYTSIILNFSAQTGSNQTQDIIDSKLEKRRKGVLGAPLGKKCVCFVDDLNMPAKEEYGAQPAVEILRQWMDHAGWYDRAENEYRQLVDIQFIAAMGPPGGGRTQITQRYVRHFNLINFVPFNHESLSRVFTTILDWSLSRGFSAGVKQLSGQIVQSTISMYDGISKGLLPTPTKSHYTFNLRDLSKVFQGLAQGDATLINSKESMIKLWCHESLRVFHDRLISEADRMWFVDALRTSVKENFDVDYDTKVAKKGLPLMFGDYMDSSLPADKRMYREVEDEMSLHSAMSFFLHEFNVEAKSGMALVLFLNAMEHISRIARIISQPYGNALLMGVGGSGRKSLTTLAVFICDYELVQIEISKSYGKLDWAEDLKRIFNKAGAEGGSGSPTVFLFDDTQIVYESFLEDVNLILNTGEVPNLFGPEDLAAINDEIGRSANAAGVNTSSMSEMYKYFISRCRANLHVVLCLSPIGDAFRRRLRMFPALVNCCTLDWFTAWPEEALRSVAEFFLNGEDLSDDVKRGVVDVCVDMQERVSMLSERYVTEMGRHYYVTPTSYLQLIGTFKKLLAIQSGNVAESKNRYDNGLEKIESTNNQVDGMQRDLEALQPKLKQATIDTGALIAKIAVDTKEANKVEEVVNSERAACEAQAAEASAIATSCQADLDKAMPALEGAISALKSLSKSDIVEIKAMKKPPDAVKLVLEAVCIMCNVKPDKVKDPNGGTKKIDDYWGPAQKNLLGDSHFLQNLMEYDKDHMNDAMVQKVLTYTNQENFTVEVVKKASVAAAGLCKWVTAMMIYDKVAKDVGPKRIALKAAEDSLREASEALAGKEVALKEVQDQLASLNTQLDSETKKKVDLENMVKDCATKLDRAEQLIRGLGGERSRWSELSRRLEVEFENVTGDVLLASGVIAYLGAFVVSYRNSALTEWKARLKKVNIKCAEDFTLRATLGEEVQIRTWVINKLPNDSFSVENAIMLQRSTRWPLMIDPQGQANRWVKKTYAGTQDKGSQLKVVKLNQATFARTIENAIPFGVPVLIENVGEVLDPVLEPILLKQIQSQGGVLSMRFGDSTLEYDERFQLFITTKLRNPHYPPELCVKVNLLNFMATAEGLEDQMLGLAVACEEPSLEQQREQLVMEDAENKRALKEIEDKILYLLRVAEGNILDDENLIDTLKESKVKSKKIEEKVRDAARTSEIIAKTRKGYKPVAFHASQLFFCIADLSLIDPMYQYSMEWYQALFREAIAKSPKALANNDLEERLGNLIDTFTYVLYLNVCRSLFEKDKLLFSFLLTMKIMSGKGKLDAAHLRFFLAGNTLLEREREPPVEAAEWLNDKTWGDILALSKLPGGGFAKIAEDFFNPTQREKWRKVYESKKPMADLEAMLLTEAAVKEEEPELSGEDVVVVEEENLFSNFEMMCVLRAIRPDFVVPQVQSFVAREMGQRFIEVPSFDLGACFEDSKCDTPLLFVLTPGADPMSALYKLAEEKGFNGARLHAISLGQGQGEIAYAAISEAQDKGSWVCLQNCHLSISWMPTLERLCEELSPDRIHGEFRLWLTSEPSPAFPAYILQNGIKMTIEPPKGMRANLIGSFTTQIAESFFDGVAGEKRSREFKKLLYGLCFFHASVRERLKYGPLGWNIKYVFSGADLQISMDQLRIFCDNTAPEDALPYAALRYLTGECNYGGRVTDDKDRRCLANVLTDFYSVEVQDDSYKFSVSGIYFAPKSGSFDSVRDFIRELPFTEGPELFGLHDNANISCALGETNQLLSTVLSMQPRSSGGAGKSWDSVLAEVASDIESRLPELFDIERALIDFPVCYDESMNTVLTQELLRFNKLTGLIKGKLYSVQRAIKGLVVMSGELEEMGNSMVNGKVPKIWSQAAYPSRKPLGSWVADLLERLLFLKAWVVAQNAPPVFWISGFFFTQAFITGTLQNYARKYQLPIDTVDFDQTILTAQQEEKALASTSKEEDGSVCRGLFMEGARFDVETHVIAESRPRELFTHVPMFLLLPKLKADIESVRGSPELYTGEIAGTAHVYMCPIYKESNRQGTLSTTGHSTNFVMFIRVPMATLHQQKFWIKRGAAMLTQLDD